MYTPLFGFDPVKIHFNNLTEAEHKGLVAPHLSGPHDGQQYFYGMPYYPIHGYIFSMRLSLMRFLPDYDGIQLATGDYIKPAFEVIEEKLGLSVRNRPVTGMELAMIFEATMPLEYYLRLMRDKHGFKIKKYQNGWYLLSGETKLVIYNKTRELVDKGKIVFDPDAPQLIKVELRLNRKLRQKIAPWLDVLDLESLSDPNVLHSLARIYESYTARLLNLDDFTPGNKRRLTTLDYLAIAAEELRLRRPLEHEEVLSEILDIHGADDKVRQRIAAILETEQLYRCGSEVRHHMKQLCNAWYGKYPFHAEADPAIREFMDKLREFSKNRRTTEAEKRDMRAAQAITSSPAL